MRRFLLFAWWRVHPSMNIRLLRRAIREFGHVPAFIGTYVRGLRMSRDEAAFVAAEIASAYLDGQSAVNQVEP